jgi:hypothetical protein
MSDMPQNTPKRDDMPGTPRRRIVGMYDRPEKAAPSLSPLLISGLLIALFLLVAFVLYMLLR